MSPPANLPDDILFLIIQASVPEYDFIRVRQHAQDSGVITKSSIQAFHTNGLPNILNLQLVNKTIREMAESCLRSRYRGGLRLEAIEGNLERLILSQDARLHWIIPRVTHLSFPIHFQDLDKLNSMLGNGINLPNLRTMHIEWQMRIVAWNLMVADDADENHLNEFVEQTVKAERQRKVSIGRYIDTLREILGKQEGFKLTIDYIFEVGHRSRGDVYHQFTVDVSTHETVVVAHRPFQT